MMCTQDSFVSQRTLSADLVLWYFLWPNPAVLRGRHMLLVERLWNSIDVEMDKRCRFFIAAAAVAWWQLTYLKKGHMLQGKRWTRIDRQRSTRKAFVNLERQYLKQAISSLSYSKFLLNKYGLQKCHFCARKTLSWNICFHSNTVYKTRNIKNFGVRHAVTVVSSGQPVVYAKGPITIWRGSAFLLLKITLKIMKVKIRKLRPILAGCSTTVLILGVRPSTRIHPILLKKTTSC